MGKSLVTGRKRVRYMAKKWLPAGKFIQFSYILQETDQIKTQLIKVLFFFRKKIYYANCVCGIKIHFNVLADFITKSLQKKSLFDLTTLNFFAFQ